LQTWYYSSSENEVNSQEEIRYFCCFE